MNDQSITSIRPDDAEAIEALFALPFNDLLYRAHTVHRRHFDPNEVETCALLSIKTGGCSEDCGYCSQSARHEGPASRGTPIMDSDEVRAAAKRAKAQGARRLCMGAAWRGPKQAHLERIVEFIRIAKAEGLETCMTLGFLSEEQARQLKEAGLDYYNHNINTSPEHHANIVTTHTFEDRIETIANAQKAGLKVCCGGILGMGESRRDRARMLQALAQLPEPPRSVPINVLVPMPGTPLENAPPLEPFELVRTIAVARILLPTSRIRLSAGRHAMSDELQALCFFAGANSIFLGEKLLTTDNATPERDKALFAQLGIVPRPQEKHAGSTETRTSKTA